MQTPKDEKKEEVINNFIPDNKENSEENQIKSTVKKQHLMILDEANSSEAAVLHNEVKTSNNFIASTSPHLTPPIREKNKVQKVTCLVRETISLVTAGSLQ